MSIPITKNNVTWAQLWGVVCGLIAFGGAVLTFVWSAHSAHPHVGAVSEKEMEHFVDRMEDNLQMIRSQLEEIKKRLEGR